MSMTLLARVIPVSAIPSSRFRHVLRREVLAAKSWALTILTGFFEPVFYLFSLGVGLGGLIGTVTYQGVEVEFVQFVAPGLLAASAMNGAIFESTMNCFYKLTMAKTFDAMLQTPLQPGDVAAGEIAYAQARGTLYSAVFLAIMALLGYVASPWGILALPVCMLIGFAFSAFGLTLTTYMRSWADFDLIFTGVLPVFLLSTTFFPIEVYPVAVRPIVWLSPLYHGVELVRAATLGIADWTLAIHLAVLVVLAVVGTLMTGRRLEKLLLR
ncbi:MAG: lipooligosaccharide transport system permease protein [Nonlabens sp.]|jgi:lipooligosaccharide transport system permease protein